MTLKTFVQLELLGNKDLLKNLEQLKSHEDKLTPERYEELKGNILAGSQVLRQQLRSRPD